MEKTSAMERKFNVPVDIHLGPTFDPEKCLDLERRLFKVEPRPIPSQKKATKKVPQERTVLASFVRAATKFACKLDSILRAPFEVFASKHGSNAEERTAFEETLEIPEHRASLRDDNLKKRVTSSDQLHSGSDTGMMRTPRDKNISFRVFPGICKGHVMNMVKLYEERSDVTSGSSVKAATKHQSVHGRSEVEIPPRAVGKESLTESSQWSVIPRCLHQIEDHRSTATSKAYGGFYSCTMKQKSVILPQDKLDKREKFCEEKELSGDTPVINCGQSTGGYRREHGRVNTHGGGMMKWHNVFHVRI